MADKKKIELPKWAGRQILDESHAEELDSRAAAHEVEDKLPRTKAEEEAYRKYVKEHHAKAAAHHLSGMKAAQGAGSMDEARKHGVMYALHIKELGEDEYGPVPHSVKQHLDSPDREHVYGFKAHKGDAFLFKDGEKDREPAKKEPGKDAQSNFNTLESAHDEPGDSERFDLGKAEPRQMPLIPKERSMTPEKNPPGTTCRGCGGYGRVPDFDASRTKYAKKFKPCPDCTSEETKKSEEEINDRLHDLYKAITFLEKAWSFSASAKVGDYETKRCDKCKRETIHKQGKCKVCGSSSVPETSPKPVDKAEGHATIAEVENDGPMLEKAKAIGEQRSAHAIPKGPDFQGSANHPEIKQKPKPREHCGECCYKEAPKKMGGKCACKCHLKQ